MIKRESFSMGEKVHGILRRHLCCAFRAWLPRNFSKSYLHFLFTRFLLQMILVLSICERISRHLHTKGLQRRRQWIKIFSILAFAFYVLMNCEIHICTTSCKMTFDFISVLNKKVTAMKCQKGLPFFWLPSEVKQRF